MKRLTFLIVLLCLASLGICAQGPRDAATGKSSQTAVDALSNLDPSVLSDAIVGIVNEGHDDELEVNTHPYQKIYFSPGFRILFVERCQMFIRNDKSRITEGFIAINSNYEDLAAFYRKAESDGISRSVVINLPLDEMNHKKGRKAYRLTSDPERAAKYGTWRVQLKAKAEDNIIGVKTSFQDEEMDTDGGIITFSFSDEAKSKLFDTTIRAAIKQCNQ